MKICFITDNIFSLGGIQRVLSVLASELSKYHHIDVLCLNKESKIDRNIYNLSGKVNVQIEGQLLDQKYIAKSLFKIVKLFNVKTNLINTKRCKSLLTETYYPKEIQDRFVEYLNSKSYDVIIGVAGYYSLLLAIISDRISAKTIGWQHNSYDAYLRTKQKYFWHQDILFNEYIPRLDKYIVLTEYDRNMFLKENNIDSIVMYNPKSFSSAIKSNVSSKQFLAAGRFTHQKGFDLLIESFYEFCKQNDDWNLALVGDGEEKVKILDMIKKYNLDNRISVENFTDNIQQYFLDSSALLLPSRWEGMPMIVLESLEMGVPIISYDITAVEALVTNNVEGLVSNKFDTVSFATAMKKISESYEIRYKLSQNAIEKSKEFNIDSIASKWMEILSK